MKPLKVRTTGLFSLGIARGKDDFGGALDLYHREARNDLSRQLGDIIGDGKPRYIRYLDPEETAVPIDLIMSKFSMVVAFTNVDDLEAPGDWLFSDFHPDQSLIRLALNSEKGIREFTKTNYKNIWELVC